MANSLDIDPHTHILKLNPRDSKFYSDTSRFYAAIHKFKRPLFWKDYNHWCFFDYKNVHSLLRDKRFGRQMKGAPDKGISGKSHLDDFNALEVHSLLELEPPEHTRLRTLINRAFVSRKIEYLKPYIEKLAHQLIDDFETAGEIELLKNFAEIIPVHIIAQMLGVPVEMAPQLLDWSHRMVKLYMFEPSLEVENDANQAAKEFTEFLHSLILQRRQMPSDDLISHLIAEQSGQSEQFDRDALTDMELISTIVLLLNAGHEATVHQIGNAVKVILEHDYSPDELFHSDKQTVLTIEELMRIEAPLHMFKRYVLEDVELDHDIYLKKGDQIGLMLGAANLDPVYFPNPNEFIPSRQQGAHLSFGGGIHFCVGAPLARLELQIALPILFKRLPKIRLAKPVKWRDAYHFHGLERLDFCWS